MLNWDKPFIQWTIDELVEALEFRINNPHSIDTETIFKQLIQHAQLGYELRQEINKTGYSLDYENGKWIVAHDEYKPAGFAFHSLLNALEEINGT